MWADPAAATLGAAIELRAPLAPRRPPRYGARMDRDAIRAWAERPWSDVAGAKRAWHARRFREAGAASGVALSRGLREHARRVRPDWPTARNRERDLAHHVELKRLLDRAAHAFAGR